MSREAIDELGLGPDEDFDPPVEPGSFSSHIKTTTAIQKKKKADLREFLFYAQIDSIRFKKIKDLTQEEALADGFSGTEEAILKIMYINNIKNRERYCYLVKFHKIPETPELQKIRKSILFTHLRDKLVNGTKGQTVRMLFMPNYIEQEVVRIVFKVKELKT